MVMAFVRSRWKRAPPVASIAAEVTSASKAETVGWPEIFVS